MEKSKYQIATLVLLLAAVTVGAQEIPRAVPVDAPTPIAVPREQPIPRAEPVRRAEPVQPTAPDTRGILRAAPTPMPTPQPAATSIRGIIDNPANPQQQPAQPAPTAMPVRRPLVDPTPLPADSATQYSLDQPINDVGTSGTPEAPAAQPEAEEPIDPDTEVIRMAPDAPNTNVRPDEVKFRVASGLYQKELFDLAATEYAEYLEMFPNGERRAAATYRMAECYRAMDQEVRARNIYQTLISDFRSGEYVGSAAYRMAELADSEKDYEEALFYFKKAVNNLTDKRVKLGAMFRVGQSYEALERLESARSAYRQVIADAEDNPYMDPATLALAKVAEATGRKTEAFRYYSALAETAENPKLKAESAVSAGVLATKLDRNEEAEKLFNQVINSETSGDWKNIAQLGLIRLSYEQGDYQAVIDNFEKNPKIVSEDLRPEVLLLVANSYRRLGKHESARDRYGEIVEEFPNSTFSKEAEFQRLVSMYAADDEGLLETINAYLAENTLGERAEKVRLLKAEYLYKQNRFAEAIPEYSALMEAALDRDLRADVLNKLAWCKSQTGDVAGAIEAYSQFLESFRRHGLIPSVLVQRGLSLQKQGAFAEALKDFTTVVESYPEAPEREVALQQQALILGQQKDNEGMAAAFQTLLDDYPKSAAAAQANYWIGWVKFENKEYAEAIPPLQKSRELDPDDYYEKASLRVILAQYYQENLDAVAANVDQFVAKDRKTMIPAEILKWIGMEYYQAEDYAKAEKYFNTLTGRENPHDPPLDVWLYQARSQNKQQKWQEAMASIAPYIEKAEENSEKAAGLLVRGEAELNLSDYEQTNTTVEEVLTLQREGLLNARARMIGAEIELRNDRYVEASKAFQRVALLYDDYEEIAPVALEKAYTALKKIGQGDEADKVLNELQTRYPEYKLGEASAKI